MLRPDSPPSVPEIADLLGDLRALLVRCREPELLLVQAWLRAELGQASRARLRLVRTPSAYQPETWEGTFVELAGRIRRDIHDLPPTELLVLHGWVRDRLSCLGG